MSIEQMRELVISVYPGKAWEERVRKMSDNQILAIYNRFLYTGKFNK